MPTLLRIDSSVDLEGSRTRRLTAAAAESWSARGADYTVISRDVHHHPLPHLVTPAQHWAEPLREGAEVPADLDALQRTVIAELISADAVVIGAPMYNYSMPATLKTWLDLIHVPGVTAPFGDETQPMKGRTAIVVSARGAIYDAGTPTEGWDHVTPPLQLVLGESLGMDVHIVTVDRTLAAKVPPLDADIAAAQLDAALAETRRLATAASVR